MGTRWLARIERREAAVVVMAAIFAGEDVLRRGGNRFGGLAMAMIVRSTVVCEPTSLSKLRFPRIVSTKLCRETP